MPEPEIVVHRLAAFTDEPSGGNPAGVVLTESALPEDVMQHIAADVGYSETAFLACSTDDRRTWQIRYYSPLAEVPFCGHATIASGVLLGEQIGPGRFTLHTAAGTVTVVATERSGRTMVTLTSVTPAVEPADPTLVTEILGACELTERHLDDRYPPAVASAGARHLVLVLRARADLRALAYDFDRVLASMTVHELTTIACLWPDPADGRWHARNLFPVGGVVEDPATGAAAAAFGAYVRAIAAVEPPTAFEVLQGEDLGRPSRLLVSVPAGDGGIDVSGTAVAMDVDPHATSAPAYGLRPGTPR